MSLLWEAVRLLLSRSPRFEGLLTQPLPSAGEMSSGRRPGGGMSSVEISLLKSTKASIFSAFWLLLGWPMIALMYYPLLSSILFWNPAGRYFKEMHGK